VVFVEWVFVGFLFVELIVVEMVSVEIVLGLLGSQKKNSFGAKGRGKGKSYRAKSRRQRSPSVQNAEGIVINVKRYDMVLQVNQFRDREILSAITY